MRVFSVAFYKRLFLLILAALILVPTCLCVWLSVRCSVLEKQLAQVSSQPSVQSEPPIETPDRAKPSPTPTVPPASEEPSPDIAGVQPIAPAVSSAPAPKPVKQTPAPSEELPAYQFLYPELYSTAELPQQRVRAENTVYLTFDCSPSGNTGKILDILDDYGIKATFFVVGHTDQKSLEMMRQIVDRGHSIGLRSYSDSYSDIYQSVEAFLEDFAQIYQLVYDTTGIRAEIFRFPTGSLNAYDREIYSDLVAEMLRRGFVYFDWNVTGEDAAVREQSAQALEEKILQGMEGRQRGIVMFHDVSDKTAVVEALGPIIEALSGQGYEFQPLTAAVLPVVF